MSARVIVAAGRVATCDPGRAHGGDALGIIDDGAVLIEDGRIVAVGPRDEVIRSAVPGTGVVQRPDGLLTPGLIDAHTHAPFAGSRHVEYVLRMSGADYETIAAAGGGIVATMRSVRAASRAELVCALAERVQRMARLGVTTIEAKSGYGLDLENELKQLEALAEVGARNDVPRLVPTYLALHALDPDARMDHTSFAARVAASDLPSIAAAGLAQFVDAYVDRGAFSTEHARLVLGRARELGLGVRIHAGQFADVGGAELAAELQAASADHLEHVSANGVESMAAAGVRAVLLPVASFTLGQAPPPIALLRERRVRLVVASDANPGTAPTDSLPLALALAVRTYGLTVAEAVLGATREAALSLGLKDVGVLAAGARADVVLWDLPHEAALIQPHGAPRTVAVWRDGKAIA